MNTQTKPEQQVISYDNSMMLFSSRWAALSLDIVMVFTAFFIVKTNFTILHNWLTFLSLYGLIHILLPMFMKECRSLGKVFLRVRLIYPEQLTLGQRKLYYGLRELIKIGSILLTAGMILIITPILISEKSKPTLHEKFTGVIAKRKLGKNDTIADDGFTGKLNI